MKKVLFATTALVMTAGVAAAEVAVSGDGRMGMIYDGNDAQFSSRARVTFTLTGESDAGLSFGGAFRVDQESDYTAGYAGSERSAARGTAGAVWISGTYGKLSMGDVVGAAEAAIGDLPEVGYTDGEFGGDIEEINYLVGDGENEDQGPTILYEYTVNNISFFASATDGSNNSTYGVAGSDEGEDVPSDSVAYSLAVKYEGSNWWAALSYSEADVYDLDPTSTSVTASASELALAGGASFNNFSVMATYLKYDDRFVSGPVLGDDEFIVGGFAVDATLEETIGLGATYQMDAILVEGFYRKDKYDLIGGGSESYDSFGIGADYDLGGGAVLAGGIIDTDYLDDTVADIGVKFKF
ncbi:porin [Paracoccus sp. DMF]|uniref:porin n=1 Tax=Paracoccus sp. DMF TaxID=400837 RepID=UPI0011048055|nr:porin [Paracoccus sp. DMF]MCV2445947.1 porin [Paracoccus sp. DMF]